MIPSLFWLLLFATTISAADDSPTGYVGSERCAQCHEAETKAWRGSHHDLAMAEASDQTILGDFNDAEITAHGVTSRFYRKDGGFYGDCQVVARVVG